MLEIFQFLKDIFFFGGYMDKVSFPRPLSAAEEREYIERCYAGDEEARNKLIEHNLRLVVHIAKKYSSSGAERDDFISIGTIGLIKGVNTYDKAKSIRLATYVSRCIENEILMFLRKNAKTMNDMPLNEAIGEDKDGNSISLMDVLGTDKEGVEAKVEQKLSMERIMENYSDRLTAREKVVIELRYGLSGKEILPQRTVAQKLGISRSYVSRIEKRALKKLRQVLEEKSSLHR